MKIGLIGLPGSGKTTVFNALTGSTADTGVFSSGKSEPNLAVVEVRDERVTRLSEMFNPRKTIYATIELMDFAGLVQDGTKKELFTGKSMGLIKNVNALGVLLRNFQDDIHETISPLKDLELIESEILLNDLILAETRLERIEAGFKRGQTTPALKAEDAILRRICEQLNQNRSIRELDISEEDQRLIRGFQFLTQKPLLAILNSDEARFGKSGDIVTEIETRYNAVEFAGRFEMDLAALDPEEARDFMQDMGIETSARDRLTNLAYRTMNYISFFTVGQDEVRAWTLHKGMTAVDAAGTIHTDLARGFIRAECFTYNDLIELGSEKAVKEKGRFRLEGKEYIVKDSDILNIRSGV